MRDEAYNLELPTPKLLNLNNTAKYSKVFVLWADTYIKKCGKRYIFFEKQARGFNFVRAKLPLDFTTISYSLDWNGEDSPYKMTQVRQKFRLLP